MKAVLCREFGPPDTLRVEDVPSRPLGPGEVRIAVEAAGVNFPDTLIIEGKYQVRPDMPFSPGGEVAGTIAEVGADVRGWAAGDAVLSLPGWGGFAEELVTTSETLLRRPATMDATTAAGFGLTYGTSMHALKDRARLRPGETLVVLGAAGGVGLAAVEIGRVLGARVIAAASSPEKIGVAKAHGAHEGIDYTRTPLKDAIKAQTEGRGVDVIYDPVGGETTEAALRSLAWGGRLLVVGFAAGSIPKLPANLLLLKGAAAVGVFWGRFRKEEPETDAENFRQLFDWHAQGKLSPLVSRTYPLEDAADALRAISNREATGKLVLVT